MTLNEAAALLGVRPATLRQQAIRGALEAVKHGRDWWVEADEVERYRATRLGTRRPAHKEETR